MGQSLLDRLIPPSSTMKMFVVLALAAAAVAEPEAAADAQYISAYGAYPYAGYPYTTPYVKSIAASVVKTVATPFTYSTYSSPLISSLYNRHIIAKREAEADPALIYSNAITPYTSTYAATAYPYSHIATPFVNTFASHIVPTVGSHTITSYNNPHHYTAVLKGVFGPKYVAKNGPVEHIVKREADPALIYNSAWSVPHVAAPLTTTYNHVATPLTTYNNIIASPINYAAHVATPITSNGAHAVAATTAGWTHSSNVGICTNVNGQQVAC